MENLKTEIEQIKVQLFTGIKLGRIEKEWGEMIIGTCDRALTIPVVVGRSEQLVCEHKYQDNVCDWRGVRKCIICGQMEKAN